MHSHETSGITADAADVDEGRTAEFPHGQDPSVAHGEE